jgi:tetratricopeptide (TPR) repeat protein
MVCWPAIAHYLGQLALALGRPDAAIAHAQRALRVCEHMGASGHRAWVECGLAEALGSHPSAREHFGKALDLAQALEMPEVAQAAERGLRSLSAADGGEPARHSHAPPEIPVFGLREDGDLWSITHAGQTFRLKSMRGLKMLARLCEQPGRELHALDLVAESSGEPGVSADRGDAGEVLDPRARDTYKSRIAELREAIDEAERFGDGARATRAREELEALTRQLSAAFGLGGRARRTGSAAERARISAQRRLREAIRKIAESDPELGRHLDWTIRTGLFCAYEPAGRVG